jgi:hypothetical protein
MTMEPDSQRLSTIVSEAYPRLRAISDVQASDKPYPDKWSLKELLGHLIDSASNNHQRIVRMQELPSIGTFRYSQLHWVSAQQYQQEPWNDLVELWYRYNRHMAHIIAHTNTDSLPNVCDVGDAEPATLSFLIRDYVRHVEHHLEQLFSGADPREGIY